MICPSRRTMSMSFRQCCTQRLRMASPEIAASPGNGNGAQTRSIDFFFESLAADQHECAIRRSFFPARPRTAPSRSLEAIEGEGGITLCTQRSPRPNMNSDACAAPTGGGMRGFCAAAGPGWSAKLVRIAKRLPWSAVGAAMESSPAHGGPGNRATAARYPVSAENLPEQLETRRLQKNPAPAAQSFQRRFFALQIQHHPAARFSRRMVFEQSGFDAFDAYAQFLRHNAKELDALYSDVLINVTSFFRNPDAFDVLKREVFPKLVAGTAAMAWCAGSGCWAVPPARRHIPWPWPSRSIATTCRISAQAADFCHTDASEALLGKSPRRSLRQERHAGCHHPAGCGPFLLSSRRGGCRIQSKRLRQVIVASRGKNLLSDPPFSRMDLISCRNLLIYIESSLQNQVATDLPITRSSRGNFILSGSESIGTFTSLFEVVDKKHKIYCRKAGPSPALQMRPPVLAERGRTRSPPATSRHEISRRIAPPRSTPSARPTASRAIATLRPACWSMPSCRSCSFAAIPAPI